MKCITEQEVVTKTYWQTTDGRKFADEKIAQAHQDIVDGKKKLCPACDGRGAIEKYDNTGGMCRSTGEDPPIRNCVCRTCDGTRVVDVSYRREKRMEYASCFDRLAE